MCDFEFGSSLLSTVSFDAHPSLGGHTSFKEEDPNGFDITPIVSPSLSSLSSIYSPTPISSLQGGLFKSTIEMNRIEYCTRSRLLENSDHAYFAIFLASKYINNNDALLYPHVFAYIDNALSECTFHSRVGNKFEVNTISMGFIKGKNLAQQFPSRTQRTKSTNFSTTLNNKTLKYTYVCIPEQENKWFEHRWKIESDNGGSYYLCIDVPGPGVKRKRTVKVAEKSKTQKIFHETPSPNSFSFTWCPVSPVSSPSLSPTPSRSSSFSSISSPPSVVPCSPTASISPLSSPFVSSSPIIPSSVSCLSPCSNPVPALTSVQDLDLFLTSLCNN